MDDQGLEPRRLGKRPLRQRSSAATTGRDYDVFLNHRGPDVKAGFVAHLDEALRTVGLNPFLDKASLRKGDPAFGCIEDALAESKVHVAVISKGYAESKYSLSELVAMMRSGKPVVPVFYDVEPLQVRSVESGPFAEAFEKHELKRSAEQVEEWRDALGKVAEITGFCFRLSDYKGDEVQLKWEVVDAVLGMIPAKEELYVGHHLVGVEEPVRTCINKLEMMSGATCILGLVGMGGVGKSTLAKEIYNHFGVKKRFQAMTFLEIDNHSTSSIEVGRNIVSRLQEQLLWDLLQVPHNNLQTYRYWFKRLSQQGPVLVVLDGLDERSQFDKVILDKSLLASGSCIIVTSRDGHVLKVIGGESNFHLHEVIPLGCDDAQKLFNLYAFGKEDAPEKFKVVSMNVSKECGGLPLALKVVGSRSFDKRSDEDLKCVWPEAVDALKKDKSVMSVLQWSYDCLSEEEKVMFVDIACIFCGWEKEEAMEIWKGCKKDQCCGVTTPNTSLKNLVDKCLVVVESSRGSKSLSMHGLLRALGESIGMCEGSHLWESKARKAMEYKILGLNKVRALNLANSGRKEFESKNLVKMTNLHFLVLDKCNVSGDLGSISEELQWLRWRYMPLTFIPPTLKLANLVSLDFSWSTKLAGLWVDLDPPLETCPNLLNLNLRHCTSIKTLPNSIGRLSRLQMLDVSFCKNLRKLPSSIGQLTALQDLYLGDCKRLGALPQSITTLSGFRMLYVSGCSSISNLPTAFELMAGFDACGSIYMDLGTESQARVLAYLNAPIPHLAIEDCSGEAISVLDGLRALGNLHYLVVWVHLEICTTSWSHLWEGNARKAMEHKTLGLNKVGALNLANSGRKEFESKNLGKMTNLHFLMLDKCNVSGGLGSISEELQWLRWRYMPLTFISPALKLANLVSMDFSWSTKLASLWVDLDPALESCPNLLKLNLQCCTSIKTLPDSIGELSRLQMLNLNACFNLRKLPSSIGQLTALQKLYLGQCERLEALPESITALSGLQWLDIDGCSSISNLPKIFGLMTRLMDNGSLSMDLATEGQVCALAQLDAHISGLLVVDCSDEAMSVLDCLGTLGNLQRHLRSFMFWDCASMTKMPTTIGLLTHLTTLMLENCEKLRKLPNSIGQLKQLKILELRGCYSLQTLPSSLGALPLLESLVIVMCVSLTKLPKSLGHLSRLKFLYIEGCSELQQLPECIKQLYALECLTILGCGSLERMGSWGW